MFWKIQDKYAKNYTANGSNDMATAEQPAIKQIQSYPDTSPDEYNANSNGDIFGEVFDSEMFEFHYYIIASFGKIKNMRTFIKVKTNSRRPGVAKAVDGYKVRVKTGPIDGKANKEVKELLSDFFHVPKSHIHIKAGLKSKNKIVDIWD